MITLLELNEQPYSISAAECNTFIKNQQGCFIWGTQHFMNRFHVNTVNLVKKQRKAN